MAAPTVAALRQAIADTLTATIPATAYQVVPYTLAKPTPPFLFVMPNGIDYDIANARGLDEWKFIVRAGVAYQTDQGAQVNLDQLISGTYCIKDILEHDRQLGNHCSNLVVTSVSAPQLAQRDDGTSYMVCDWSLTVWAVGA